MGNTRDEMTRRREISSSGFGPSGPKPDEELPIVLEGEDRPIVVENDGPVPGDGSPPSYTFEEFPVYADELEGATPEDSPTPTLPHHARRDTMINTAVRRS